MNIDARAPRLVVFARQVQAAVAHVPAGLEINQRHIAVIISNRQYFLRESKAGRKNDGRISNQSRIETKSQRCNARARAYLVLHLRGAHAHGNKLHHFRIANATLRLERLRVKECDAVTDWMRERDEKGQTNETRRSAFTSQSGRFRVRAIEAANGELVRQREVGRVNHPRRRRAARQGAEVGKRKYKTIEPLCRSKTNGLSMNAPCPAAAGARRAARAGGRRQRGGNRRVLGRRR